MGPISSTMPRHRTAVPGFGSTPSTAQQPPTRAPSPSPATSSAHPLAAADQNPARRRDDLIAAHMPTAARIARSFAGRGLDLDDLTQVAMLELVRVAGRFDPAHGTEFLNYAYPCILGALKRHFRDNGWDMHITRRMQELHLLTTRAIPRLSQLLGRTPTATDLATHLHLSEQDVHDGVHSRLAYTARSLDQPAGDGGDGEFGQLIGELDRRLEAVPDRHALAQYVTGLPERERSILYLRFIDDLTQRQIGEELGISQMHVSRLLRRTLETLRKAILG